MSSMPFTALYPFQSSLSKPDGKEMISVTRIGEPEDAVAIGHAAGLEIMIN